MRETSCPFKKCRGKDPACKDGVFIYRCANLNCDTEEYYQNAIEVVNNYDFSILTKKRDEGGYEFKTKTSLNFYKNRCRKEICQNTAVDKKKRACDGCRTDADEDFQCRCAYLCGHGICDKQKEMWGGKHYEILYYQLPVSDNYNGKIDLVIRKIGTNDIYLTEFKPNDSREHLLRMITEIVTYRQTSDEACINFFNGVYKNQNMGLEPKNIHTAIMFCEKTPQNIEYEHMTDGIRRLIRWHHITVFELTTDRDIKLLEENHI